MSHFKIVNDRKLKSVCLIRQREFIDTVVTGNLEVLTSGEV